MAICPKCQSEVQIAPQFFGGLFTCPKCQAVYFTNFDGIPEGSAQEPAPLEMSGPMDPGAAFEPAPMTETMPLTAEETPTPNDFAPLDSVVENFDPVPDAPVPLAEPDLKDVVRYGNTDQSGSPMTYRLTIDGLDLLQSVNELKEVLSDSKLQIDFNALKKRIREGRLVIEQLSPAKAAVLAQRLRALNLSMKWELKLYE